MKSKLTKEFQQYLNDQLVKAFDPWKNEKQIKITVERSKNRRRNRKVKSGKLKAGCPDAT